MLSKGGPLEKGIGSAAASELDMGAVNPSLKLLPASETEAAPGPAVKRLESLIESYRGLADVFHELLAEQSLDALLDRIADALADLIPHDTLTIFEVDELTGDLVPMLARDQWAEKILSMRIKVGVGITGWAAQHREAVLTNQAHLDPRVSIVPGTPADEPEALISIPLIARGALKGALNVYRLGEKAEFDEDEFELAKRFGDAAALALDNAQIRARLEYQAQTDSLTGLYNHRYFHERLREELRRASRSRESVAVLMLDLDDFKRVNDVYGHGTGDEVLKSLASALRATVRTSDVVCRLGGEEFGLIVTSFAEESAFSLARRVKDSLTTIDFGAAGTVTISVGIAQGPEHAMNPRELVACAEAAMMTAKARGKNQIVLFQDGTHERPESAEGVDRDVRSIAHLKMLQSLSGKLNRLNDVREIGMVIANELRSLIDYHNCRVFVVDGDDVAPIAFQGGLATTTASVMEVLACKLGEGVTGHVAKTGESLLVADPGHRADRRVADRGAAALRLARDRRDRDLEARAQPVRRGRRPPARGARRPRVGRARERAPIRGRAPGGGVGEVPSRVQPRARDRGRPRRRPRADGRARRRTARLPADVGVARRCGDRRARLPERVGRAVAGLAAAPLRGRGRARCDRPRERIPARAR